MDYGVIGGIELNPLDVRKRKIIEGSPGFPVVARKPQARAGCAFGQGHVNPAGMLWMKIAAESLRPFTTDALPGLATVVGQVEAARLVATAGIRCAQQNSPAVARINRKIL